ncbi:MAG: hypothetical protein ABSH15_14895 [Verrucomicrobiota bacterium]
MNEASCCARGRAHSGMASSAPPPPATSEFGLKPRPEVVLSLDAKQSGLSDSSCGSGVLER